MSCDHDTAAMLRRSGQKVTPQRLMVLTALRHHQGHASAGEIFQTVRATYPYVDISTVYRTLTSLRDLGLVTETDLGAGDLSYEWAAETPHHHLVCQRCGAVSELEHSLMVPLGHEIEERYGFRPSLTHFAIFGICQPCRAGEAGAQEA